MEGLHIRYVPSNKRVKKDHENKKVKKDHEDKRKIVLNELNNGIIWSDCWKYWTLYYKVCILHASIKCINIDVWILKCEHFRWAFPHWEFSFATLVAREKNKCTPISVNALCWMNEGLMKRIKKWYVMNDAGWYLFRWIWTKTTFIMCILGLLLFVTSMFPIILRWTKKHIKNVIYQMKYYLCNKSGIIQNPFWCIENTLFIMEFPVLWVWVCVSK